MVKFAAIILDTPNYKNLKLVPSLINYFNQKTKIKIKILGITNLKGETADI